MNLKMYVSYFTSILCNVNPALLNSTSSTRQNVENFDSPI